jgi:hypothetical protein
LIYSDPLGPIDPLKFNAILAVDTDDNRKVAVADKLEVVTDVAKLVLPNGYDCIVYSLNRTCIRTINGSYWTL